MSLTDTGKKNSIVLTKGQACGYFRGTGAALLLAAITGLHAQTATSAPIPSQLTTSSKVFLSNAGEESNELSERAYTQIFNGLTQGQHYQLVSSPASADLIFELHYIAQSGQVNVTNGNTFGASYVFRIRLVILDRATHATLWTVTEFLDQNAHKHDFDLEFADTVNLVLADVQALASGQMPSTAAANKIKKP